MLFAHPHRQLLIAFCALIYSRLSLATPDLHNANFCVALLRAYQNAIIDPHVDPSQSPVARIRREFGDDVYADKLPLGLREFEDDVLNFFLLAPRLRSPTFIKEKYKLSDQDFFDAMIYYGIATFDGDTRIVSNPERVLERIRELSLASFIASEHPTAKRYRYYKENVARLSVPEMSRALRISEGQIYKDLSLLNISIVESFEHDDQAGGGATQASRFVRHHLNLENRGVPWSRSTLWNGRKMSETEILVDLFENEFSYYEIATKLNQLFQVTEATDTELRTENSVSQELNRLGLVRANPRERHDIYLPAYGYIRKEGRFLFPTMTQYLLDHKAAGLEACAYTLGLEVSHLRDFIYRVHLEKQFQLSPKFVDDLPSDVVARRFSEQALVIDATIDWIQRHSNRFPTEDHFRITEKNSIPFQFPQVMSQGKFADTGIFRSSQDYTLAVFLELERRHIPFNYFDSSLPVVHRGPIIPELKHFLQRKSVEEIIKFINKNGRAPTPGDFESEIPFKQNRFLGTLSDRVSGASFFENFSEAWLAVKKKADQEKVSLRLVDVTTGRKEITEAFAEKVREEILDICLDWIVEHDGNLTTENMIADLHLDPYKIKGMGTYSADGERAQHSYFSNQSSFFMAMKKRADARALALPFMHKMECAKEHITPEFKLAMREDALAAMHNWLVAHPKKVFTRSELRQISGIEEKKLKGIGNYAPQAELGASAIFEGVNDFWVSLKRYEIKKGNQVPFLHNAEIREETFDVILSNYLRDDFLAMAMDFVIRHRRLPLYEDMTVDKMGYSYQKVFGSGAKSGFFSNLQDFRSALLARGAGQYLDSPFQPQ